MPIIDRPNQPAQEVKLITEDASDLIRSGTVILWDLGNTYIGDKELDDDPKGQRCDTLLGLIVQRDLSALSAHAQCIYSLGILD